MIDFKALAAPFPPSAVSWRIGATKGDVGLPLAYIDARDVMDRLDEACGPSGWQCRYPTMGHVTICEIGIWIDNDWIWKADGAGATDVEGEKGILSDSFKRAAVRWGIGRYLYAVQAPWVQIEKRGNSSIIKDSEYAKLEAVLNRVGGAPGRPLLPPADQDVQDAATRWFREQTNILGMCQTDADVFEWDDRNEKALQKLKLQHRPLWDDLVDARLKALERVAVPL
jgi:hypothetical protein